MADTVHNFTVPDFNRKEFAERLRNAIPKGVTLKEVAENIGCSLGALKKWLSSDSEPSIAPISKFSQVYGVSLTWLTTGEGPETHVTSGVVDNAPLDEQLLEECIKFVREIEAERRLILTDENFAKALSGCYSYVMECREQEEEADMKAMKHALKMAM
jgi:transcriptional regulator with XRE-family HTH domain